MKTPKCSKCGRPLTNPASIARGMGPECAGTAGTGRRAPPVWLKKSHGRAYPLPALEAQIPLWPLTELACEESLTHTSEP